MNSLAWEPVTISTLFKEDNMKVALITGGSRGLGKSAALHAARRGIGVILTYHTKQAEANDVAADIEAGGGKAVALPLNTMDIAGFPGFVDEVAGALSEKWGREKLDYLVNNAGFADPAPIESTTEEQFDRLMKVHVKGPFFLTQKLLPLLENGGHIVNISSGLARFSFPGNAVYGMMKGAVEVMTRYLSKELGARGIRANTVAPGPVETDFSGGRIRNNPELKQQLASMASLGRVGEADDIGLLIAALLSDDFRWVNAQRIEASGGFLS